jgi:autotransporter-associated beta strand protein
MKREDFLQHYMAVQRPLRAYLLAATGDLHEADDLCQEVSTLPAPSTGLTCNLGHSGDILALASLESGYALHIAGSGQLNLSGTNTFSGGVMVEGGRLQITGSAGSGAVIVNGGSFGGSGAVAGPLTINVGGALAP